ncbi:MAG: 2-oxoacid:acceptor oxidoreductase family protein [Deltaproteobacteria bacterium]|uniref:2-oxoacid:acceptor oxidoreductase family protein n=1 Tax=Candidatus Zymogenus saltonus TaxID=2844893 RepID=A0A9D8KDZ3_9DELT|nr:2-oxoacid:acceptor oxidoreductase family protein [Candidatus Zymogenus saltonus]
MIEIIFHGRGGQGAVTSAEMVAHAAISEGKYAQAFPNFGPERRGAPVMAFARVDDKPIRLRSKIYKPDVAVVLDPSLLEIIDPTAGLKDDGLVIINTHKSIGEIKKQFGYTKRVAVVNASAIAREVLNLPITNTTMLGAMVATTDIVDEESMIGPLKERFGRIAEKNIKVFRRAIEETKVEV